jgi:hypothetical protein
MYTLELLILGCQCMRTDHKINEEFIRAIYFWLILILIRSICVFRTSVEEHPVLVQLNSAFVLSFSSSLRHLKVYGITSKCCFIWLGRLHNCADRLSNLLNPESPPLNKEEGKNPLIPHHHSHIYHFPHLILHLIITSPILFFVFMGYYSMHSMTAFWSPRRR